MITFNNQCDRPYDRLDVRFTKNCDNACSFCVERTGVNTVCVPDVEKMLKATKQMNHIDTVGILGGEPLLYPDKVLEYIRGVRWDKPYCKIYITTSLPVTITSKRAVCEDIFASVDGINVSVLGTDWRKHNAMLHAKSRHNRFGIIKKLARKYPDRLRICVNLYKGGVDSKEKLFELLDTMKSFGVKMIKLNEIQGNKDGYVAFEDMMGVDKMKPAYSHGCYAPITDSELNTRYPGMEFSLHRSCCFTQSTIEPGWWDAVKDFVKMIKFRLHMCGTFNVLYEDGTVSNGWLQKKN